MLKDKVAKKIKYYAWIGDDNNLQQCLATFELTTSTTNLAAIKKLQSDLTKDKERNVRNNARMLETLLLNDDDLLRIQELVEILALFTHVITIKESGIDEYIIAMLDSRFKDLNFEPEKFESTKNELQHRIKEDIKK
ncbi:1361_t:CDS:2 [Cetraspora pellucida]|uniref:1361_t:CDS:1 n=1 Tax=Cetraspora pellucida TaxID=1433469 RepID=A0ACA9K0J9_9GLOM|nr:1361_t:CDS:2 [Cetraspora pellucida]